MAVKVVFPRKKNELIRKMSGTGNQTSLNLLNKASELRKRRNIDNNLNINQNSLNLIEEKNEPNTASLFYKDKHSRLIKNSVYDNAPKISA